MLVAGMVDSSYTLILILDVSVYIYIYMSLNYVILCIHIPPGRTFAQKLSLRYWVCIGYFGVSVGFFRDWFKDYLGLVGWFRFNLGLFLGLSTVCWVNVWCCLGLF